MYLSIYMACNIDILDVLHGSNLGHQGVTWFIFGTLMCYMVHIWDIDTLYDSYLGHQCATWFIFGTLTWFIFRTSLCYMVHIWNIDMVHI